VLPIRCGDAELAVVHNLLPCALTDFPCKYLGLPLSLKKLTKDQIQPMIDRVADQLPGWKAELMTKVGRKVQVQFVLTNMLIYLIMALIFHLGLLKQWIKFSVGSFGEAAEMQKEGTVSLLGVRFVFLKNLGV